MVCVTEEENIVCQIHYEPLNKDDYKTKNNARITVRLTNTVGDLTEQIGKIFTIDENSLEIFLKPASSTTLVPLTESKHKFLKDFGVIFDKDSDNFIIARETNSIIQSFNGLCSNHTTEDVAFRDKDDDLLLGASASPTTMEGPLMLTQGPSEEPPLISLLMRQDIPYVGLVNQAMTCYLNSLLQALFMTPEFRNALYNWEFDGNDPAKSIPFQLQKLFLNLQTSSKSAVETTELTRSFGWDLSEAWQQHDIQELCRVMFDALEQKFKDTDQADLINRLYQGKMLDYVKCLECKTEKSREDTFLDIPLPVRPFGSCAAYGSVEEALRAFVQPETLEGNNQYLCEKCNKKCDAHKGLKFTKIPYLLTLHLKRFDFDYSTMHRIKLNDKVTFPETLDLNSFITPSVSEDLDTSEEINAVKCDDSSTTDSGSALDDESCQGTDMSATTNTASNHHYEYQEDDEGIDMSSGTSNMHENEKNRRHNERKGPYIYELFSIMIHSGSASGGHYYAYIKDFAKGKWYCFDDQTVTRITHDDIRKTYGGGPNRTYYSGAYSSSTNAYMLMYRQVDSERNVNAMTTEEFPKHIKELLQNLREREESDRINKERETQLCKLKLYVNHPVQNQMIELKLFLHNESTMTEALEEAYKKAKLENIVPINHCRLVYYNRIHDTIEYSFEGREEESIGEVLASLKYNYKTDSFKTDWLLEIKPKDKEFIEYKPGGVNLKVYIINILNEDIDGPLSIRGNETQSWRELKSILAKTLQMNEQRMKIASSNGSVPPYIVENEDKLIGQPSHCSPFKIYVTSMPEDEAKFLFNAKFHQIIDKFEHVISLEVILPANDKTTLEVLSIPPLDMNQNTCEKTETGAGDSTLHGVCISSKFMRYTPTHTILGQHPQRGEQHQRELPPHQQHHHQQHQDLEDSATAAHSDQSNSEDSSLSDSDRTLVGEAPDECLEQLSSTSNSPGGSDQQLSSPDEPQQEFLEENWDDERTEQIRCPSYFKATEIPTEMSEHSGKTLKILVDKRTNLSKLKKELEPYVGVPVEYFKIFRQFTTQEKEWSHLTDTLISSKDGEKLFVKLGRVLKENEHAGKVYQLVLNAPEPVKFLCDWIVAKGMTVGQAKKEILENLKKQHQIDIPYNRCRLRKKNYKSPSKVYLDDQKFVDDIILRTNWEMLIQELPCPEIVTSSDQMLIFVRQWCPSTLELKPYSEILLEEPTVAELKGKINAHSGIPVENIDYALLKGTFPHEMPILSIQTDLEWNVSANTNLSHSMPLNLTDDGSTFLFRDNREQLKQLTSEEKKEISNKDTTRMGRFSKSSLYSPRKERALKIYLDTSPKKTDDPDVD